MSGPSTRLAPVLHRGRSVSSVCAAPKSSSAAGGQSLLRKEVKNTLKDTYGKPTLVEYGHLSELTLGSGGTKPDYLGTKFILINTICDASPPATACLVPTS